jgi:arylsulfatase
VFDRLAAQGLRFTNFHTTAVCAASRAALLTGRNAHSVGMGAIPEGSIGFPGYNAVIPRSAATVLEILRQNGYGTALVGKSHGTRCMRSRPRDRLTGGRGAWAPSTSTASTARV